MAIRWYLDLGCGPREELGPEELLSLYASWQKAESLANQYRERFGVMDETQMRYDENEVSPDGKKLRQATVADLRAQSAALEALAGECAGCPASLTGAPFGCMQRISWPISGQGEQWLVAALPPGGTKALELYRETAEGLHLGASPELSRWRQAGFLEAIKAFEREEGGVTATGDQVLDMLFLRGDITPEYGLSLLLHLDAIESEDGRRMDDLGAMIAAVVGANSSADAPALRFRLVPEDGDDDSIREIKFFLYGVYAAFSLQLPLAIRM